MDPKPLSREKYIDFFENLYDDYTYFDDPDRLDICIISSIGLYEGFSMYISPVHGPEQIPQEEYKEISAAIVAGKSLEEYDYDYVSMVKSDCEPEEDYYRWSSDFQTNNDDGWYTKDEMLEDLEMTIQENAEPRRWEDMDEVELEHWYDILMEIKSDVKN